jgi:ethanolamine transporter EutH
MSNNTWYLIVGGLLAVYIAMNLMNKGKSKARKSRKFMGDYERKKKE